jgi:hypothetical protein
MRYNFSLFIALIMLAIYPQFTKAQQEAGYYSFSASSGTYTPITGTPEPDILTDSKLGDPIPIGFSFTFEGIAYDSVRASSNGFLSFNYTSTGANSATTNDLSGSATNIRPLVAPLWDDLDGRAVGGSSASYETSGVAPNRVFTFEWSAWEWRWNASDSVISFQVKLYETTNVIEFIYEQGPAPITGTGSASIGLAGVATGTPNFLSLDGAGTSPNASSTSETTSINARPATGQVYTFAPPVYYPIDMKVETVFPPVFDGCYTNAETFEVVVTNFGSNPIDFSVNNTTVGAIITGVNPQTISTVLTSGTLAFLEKDTISIPTTYDMSANGMHIFQGFTNVTGDGNTTNDTMVATVEVNTGNGSLPSMVDFTGFTGADLSASFPDWKEADGFPIPDITNSSWIEQTGLGGAGNVTARVNLYSDFHTEWIMGPKVMLGNDYQLAYDVAITNWNSTTVGDAMGADDALYVMLSQDCGYTWTAIDSVVAADALPPVLTTKKVDLSAYNGQEVILGFYATGGVVNDPEDYDVHIDNILIDEKPFTLIDPVDSTRLVVEGNPTDTVDALWMADTKLPGPVNYQWFADTVGGDFSTPYIVLPSNNAGADTMLTLDYATIDGLLDNLGLLVGDSIDLIWTVRAYSGLDSIQANETFMLRLVRGLILQPFNLIDPANATSLNVEGDINQTVSVLWEESVKGANYTWILETQAGLPVTTIPTATDTTFDLSYADIDALLNTAGVAIGNTVNLRWTVAAVIADDTTFASNGYFTLDLTRGPLTIDYGLLTPTAGSAVTIEGDPTQTIVATWEDAQSNGDGDVEYTWLLDEATGDFSSPIASFTSDNNGADEMITLNYGDLAGLLTANGINIGMTLNAQWTVITNVGDTAVGPFTLDLTRGIITGIDEANATLGAIAVYPNPSNGTFQLTLEDITATTLRMEITDINGKVLFSDQLPVVNNAVKKQIVVDHLTEGVYMLNVYSANGRSTQRLVIQH